MQWPAIPLLRKVHVTPRILSVTICTVESTLARRVCAVKGCSDLDDLALDDELVQR